MEENTICKEGIVRAIHGEEVEVKITISSACRDCHAKSICIPSDQKQETILAKSLYGETFDPGEAVQLVLRSSAGTKAVVIAYLIPLLVLIAALFGSYAITRNELASTGICLLFLLAYYLILRQQRKKIDNQFHFFVKKMNKEV